MFSEASSVALRIYEPLQLLIKTVSRFAGPSQQKTLTQIIFYSISFNAASGRVKSKSLDNLRVKVAVQSETRRISQAVANGSIWPMLEDK